MTDKNAVAELSSMAPKSNLRRFIRIFFGRKLVLFGFIMVTIFTISGIFAPFIAPYNPNTRNLTNVLAKPSLEHWLGTDTLGRDTLSRIIYGARTSLIIGISAVAIAAVIGMTMGIIAAYFGGPLYIFIMRFVDALMSLPMLMVALAIAALLGGGLGNVIIAIGIGLLATYARLMCGQVLSVKENDYIIAMKSMGARDRRIMLRHILPNCFPPLIVVMTMQIGAAILIEASLSFLSIGIKPPIAAWGAMVSDGYQHLMTSPILSFAPGLTIMVVVFSINMVGDGLRDVLDPRLRGVL
jgi:ABC-type dipeptide/oligopeptide/nickel transport system permease subunit